MWGLSWEGAIGSSLVARIPCYHYPSPNSGMGNAGCYVSQIYLNVDNSLRASCGKSALWIRFGNSSSSLTKTRRWRLLIILLLKCSSFLTMLRGRPRASQLVQMVKNLATMQETWVWSLDWEDPLEKEIATHSSILAWRIPWTKDPGGLESMGSQRIIRYNWVTHSFPPGEAHRKNIGKKYAKVWTVLPMDIIFSFLQHVLYFQKSRVSTNCCFCLVAKSHLTL